MTPSPTPESKSSWKEELGVRAKRPPLDLTQLDEETRQKILEKREAARIATQKSRARKKEKIESGEVEINEEKIQHNREYNKKLKQSLRGKLKTEGSSKPPPRKRARKESPSPNPPETPVMGESSKRALTPLADPVFSPTHSASNEPRSTSPPPPPTPHIPSREVDPETGTNENLNPEPSTSGNVSNNQPRENDENSSKILSAAHSVDTAIDIKDFTSLAGNLFPPQAKEVLWPGGKVKTRLPWISDPSNPEKNVLQIDEDHIRRITETGIPATQCDWVSYVNYNDYKDDFELGDYIRGEMSHSRVVVLRGHPFQPVTCDVESIWRNLKIPKQQTFVVSDMEERLKKPRYPHVSMTLEDFCSGCTDPSRVQCILDCPSIDGDKPNLIKFVDEGHTAWYLMQTPSSSRKNIPVDIQKSASWLLFHQALVHTYCHHDADGYLTWTQILDGFKIWILIRPVGYKEFDSRRSLWEGCLQYLNDSPDANGFYGNASERVIIYGGPGDIIFQHPGCLHEVFTPVPSVVRGGHFYSYNSLHLTEVSRAIDFVTNESLSNQSHPCASLTLAMMLAALPLFNEFQLRTKGLSALCRMVLHPTEYTGTYDDDELTITNLVQGRKKKKKITHLPDVTYARVMGEHLKAALLLDDDVCHSLGKDIHPNDFVFSSPSSWTDPGPEIEWQADLPAPLPEFKRTL